jgi:hypothetical protein
MGCATHVTLCDTLMPVTLQSQQKVHWICGLDHSSNMKPVTAL